MQLGSGPLRVSASTRTGRLLSLTSQAGLLSAKLSSEVLPKTYHPKLALHPKEEGVRAFQDTNAE